MLKKLRRKFIVVAMLSVSVVLFAIVGTINIANYVSTNQALEARLSLIADNGGTFPDMAPQKPGNMLPGMGEAGRPGQPDTESEDQAGMPEQSPKRDEAGTESADQDTEAENARSGTGQLQNGMQGLSPEDLQRHGITPESPFDTRYFTVTLTTDGDTDTVDVTKIASITSDEAVSYAKELWEKGKTEGFFGDYKYMAVADSKAGTTMYVFLNCEREISTIRTYIAASMGIGALGLIVVFVMIYFFSGKVLKPVSESYEKQKRFITDASHEIKTPLTIIDANTEVLEMMEGENEWTKSIRKQIARLTSLTEKLVFLSRMDENPDRLEKIEFSLSDAVYDTAEGFKAVAQTKGKQFETDITDGILYTGDEKSIRQMISLLLDNAMKYSSDHGTIRLSLKISGKNRILTVWNTVDEIEKGSLNVLFERFYRMDASHNSRTGGFGIGLSVVYAIVAAHKGKISAKSEDGESITFTVVF